MELSIRINLTAEDLLKLIDHKNNIPNKYGSDPLQVLSKIKEGDMCMFVSSVGLPVLENDKNKYKKILHKVGKITRYNKEDDLSYTIMIDDISCHCRGINLLKQQ